MYPNIAIPATEVMAWADFNARTFANWRTLGERLDRAITALQVGQHPAGVLDDLDVLLALRSPALPEPQVGDFHTYSAAVRKAAKLTSADARAMVKQYI
jgi:hypothetical protein